MLHNVLQGFIILLFWELQVHVGLHHITSGIQGGHMIIIELYYRVQRLYPITLGGVVA